ncbi:MAG: ribosome maturation factor RimP [Elusimicrobiota bacterium]
MKTSADKIEALINPLIEQESAELVDLTFTKDSGRWILRVFLDKEGGVSLDDCAYFSDRIGALIDSSNTIERSYVLEISSPGFDRVIKKDKDFLKFAGKPVKIILRQAWMGRRNFRGTLRGLNAGKITVACGPELFEIPKELLDEARLDLASEL